MAYKNYINNFYSERGNRWDLEIWSLTDSSLSSVEFTTGSGGFKLSYKGSDDRQDVVMPSEATIPFIVNNTDDEAFVDKILSAPDGEYFLIIRRNFVIYWWGNLNAGFDNRENKYYPYSVSLKANDFLGEVMNNKDYTTISSQNTSIGTELFYEYSTISKLFSAGWLNNAFPLGASEKVFKGNLRWTGNNQVSYNDNYNPFGIFYINPQGFESSGNNIGAYKKSDSFKEILKCFGLKMFQADGKIYALQPYNYIGNSSTFQTLTTSNAYALFPVTYEDLDNRQNAENDSSQTPDVDSGFKNTEWILEPADFTSSEWQSNGSCTSITATSFNVALTTSNLYIDLVEGSYCLSYSQNDETAYIAKEEGGVVTTLLDESGHKNFSVGAGGAELRVYNSVAGTLTVDKIGLQKGEFAHRRFLADQNWIYDRPLSAVTATFNFGNVSCSALSNFPVPSGSASESVYTTLTNIGAISASTNTSLTLQMNVFYGEAFDYLSAADNVTHVGGVLTLTLKVGTLYLTGDIDGDLSWTAVASTFTITRPIQEIAEGAENNAYYALAQPTCLSYSPDIGSFAPFFVGTGTECYIGVNYSISLPSITTGGSVSLQFNTGVINYYTDPDTSNPNVTPTPLTLTQNNLQTKWFTGATYSPAGWNPYEPNYFSLLVGENEVNQSGILFSASAEALSNYKTVDLGTLNLGISGDETTHINCIKQINPSYDYEVPTYIKVNNTGIEYNMTTLLLDQYLEPQIDPLKKIQGSYYLNDFSAFKAVVLDSEKYVFYEGTLTAESDTVSGSWYKIAASTETITNEEDDVIYVEEDDDDTPPPPNPHDLQDHIVETTNAITKGKDWIKYNSIGLSSSIINAAATKVDLMNNSRAKLYDDQKLIFCKPDLSHCIILTKDGDSTTSDTQINVDGFTPDVDYPIGSILSVVTYDLTNVIAGGSGTPAGSTTEVQYNNAGAFGADADFTWNGLTEFLNAKNIEGKHYGANIGFRTTWSDPTLTYYLNPSDFSLSSKNTVNMYTRDSGGSVVPSIYDSRSNDIFALLHLPVGYKITAVDIYMNQNRAFDVSYGEYNTDSTTSIETGGTANTQLAVSPNYTIDARYYIIIKIEYSATTDEVWGGKITLEKL
jgi:hypothetical protein